MAHATASLRPWFTHGRMVPKWIGLAVTGGLAVALFHAWSWLAFAVGLAFFFPNEYLVHRWVYHRVAVGTHVKGPARSHILHHVDPPDLARIFNDPRVSVVLGVVYLFVAWGLLFVVGAGGGLLGALGLAAAFSFGNFVGLLYYEYVHFTAHRPGVTPWMPWNRFLKKMHLWHHYKNENYWFGVTTKVFDKTLGSYRDPRGVEKSDTVRSLVPPEQLQKYIEPDARA